MSSLVAIENDSKVTFGDGGGIFIAREGKENLRRQKNTNYWNTVPFWWLVRIFCWHDKSPANGIFRGGRGGGGKSPPPWICHPTFGGHWGKNQFFSFATGLNACWVSMLICLMVGVTCKNQFLPNVRGVDDKKSGILWWARKYQLFRIIRSPRAILR